jgi:DNA ligase-1
MRSNVDDWDGQGILPILYSKTATGAINTWTCWVIGPDVWVRWGQQDGAMQEARFTCLPKNVGRSNETSAHTQAVKEAIAKWKKQIKRKYHEVLENAGETERLKPMLAKDFEGHKHKLTYPVAVQPKFDGVRCLAYLKDGQVYLQSRGGDPWLLPHIQVEMRHGFDSSYYDFVFDGELYYHGMSLQDITALARKPRPESTQLYYVIYDCFCERLGAADWKERWAWLDTWFTNWRHNFEKVVMSPTFNARSEEDVIRLHRDFVGQGYEGAIIRSYDGTYRLGVRSDALLKLKEWHDAEYRIVGWTMGKGKFELAPIFLCITDEGKEFEVVPKGTGQERYQMLQDAPQLVGQLLTVQYLDFTDDGAPKCARGIAIRDKSDL